MSDEVNLELSIVRAFGPTIGVTNIPKLVINKLNAFVDNEVDKNLELAKNLDHGNKLAGQVKQEIVIPREIIEPELFSFLLNVTKHFVKTGRGKDITKFEIINAWIVRQFENEYNPLHFHSGSVSGVCYILLPKNFGGKSQNQKRNNDLL